MNKAMNIVSCILAVLFASITAYSQNQDNSENFKIFKGKILDSKTNEPVQASISFEQLPHGNDIGNITADENGEFTIYMRNNERYNVNVQLEGYFPFVETYEASGNRNEEIYIEPGGVGSVITLENLIFEQSKADITEESYEELDKLAVMMKDNPKLEIQLEGHTDFRGSSSANMRLSELRVWAVKQYLTRKGIAGERIKTKAFGGSQPITRENTPEARAKNRRVEVRILDM